MIFINSKVQLIKTDYTKPCYISVKNNKQTKNFPKVVKSCSFCNLLYFFVLDAHRPDRQTDRPQTPYTNHRQKGLTPFDLTTTTTTTIDQLALPREKQVERTLNV